MPYLNILPTKGYLEKTPHQSIVAREELFPIVRFVLELAANDVLNNFTAVTAPTVNDDSNDGYALGSGWFDSVAQILYFAQDVTPGAAVWTQVAGGTGTVTQINTFGPIQGGPITTTGTISITQAGAATDGYLSSVDWNIFNDKVTSVSAGIGTTVSGTVQNPVVNVDEAFNFSWTGLHTYSQIPLSPGITPTLPNHFVDKAYVDALASGIIPAGTVIAATTAALPANTYNNGAAGIGATLTANGNGAFPAQDGITINLNDALLVKDEASLPTNGSYILTDPGSGGTPWILTRRASYDSPSEILQGTAIPVLSGTVNGGKVFWMIDPSVSTVGTDPIEFDILFTGAAYTASLGVQLIGMNISLDFVANDGLTLSGNSVTVAYDGTTIGIVANQLAFIGDTDDVANASTVPGANTTNALDFLYNLSSIIDITVAAAQNLITTASVVPGQLYRITDSSQLDDPNDRILIRGITATEFANNALYFDSVHDIINDAVYKIDDTPTDTMYFRRDNNGNEVWDIGGYGILFTFDWGGGLNNSNTVRGGIAVQGWGSNVMVGNTFYENSSISANGFTSNVYLTYNTIQSNAIVNGFSDNIFIGYNYIGGGATLAVANRVESCYIGESAIIDDGGFQIIGCMFPTGFTYTASANVTNTIFYPNYQNNNILFLPGVSMGINAGAGGYTIPIADGTPGQVLTTDGAGAATWQAAGGTGGLTITPILAAALKTLVNGNTADPTVVYQVTDAGEGTIGITGVLNIMAESSSALFPAGQGTFTNATMGPVFVECGYDVQTNNFTYVIERSRNNKVFCGPNFQTLLLDTSVIAVFDFDNNNWRDNTINNCQWDNASGSVATMLFLGNNWETAWVDFGSFINLEFINQSLKGVANQLGGQADIEITGAGASFECNDFYGNDSDNAIKNMGPGADITYCRLGWFSTIDMGNIVNADVRFCNFGSTSSLTIANAASVRYCEFGNGSVVTTDGSTLRCNFLGGDQGGTVGATNFHGSSSTLINCNYGTTNTNVLTTNNSLLNKCTVSSSAASGAANVITGCELNGCTVSFGAFTGCTLQNVSAVNQTFTFTGNNQTIGDRVQNNMLVLNNSTIAGAQIQLGSAGVDPTTPATGNIWFDTVTSAFSFRESSNTIRLKSDSGWSASTVTGPQKGGLTDSSSLGDIFEVWQAFENYARATAGLLHA